MAKRKGSLLCALSAAAAAALLFPYEIKVQKSEKGCCKPKKVSAKSLALYFSYTAPSEGKKGEVVFVIPGCSASECRIKKGNKTFNIDGEELIENAKSVYEECGRLRSQATEKISRTAKTAASFAEAAFKKAEEALKQKRRELAEKKEKRILEDGFSFEADDGTCCDDDMSE